MMKVIYYFFVNIFLISYGITGYAENINQAQPGSFLKTQYGVNRFQAEQTLEDTRQKLQNMLDRRGGNPYTIPIIGDMVGYWKKANLAFESGNYEEAIRICNVVQGYIF